MRYSLTMLALLSSSAFAAVDGTSVSWSNYTDMVNNSCTGTVIAGNHILTAAHCNDLKNSVMTQNGNWINPTAVEDHPSHSASANNDFDVAFLTLPNRIETAQIHFFADLNTNPVSNGDEVRLFGFGGSYDQLSYTTMTIDSPSSGITATTRYTAEKIVNAGETKEGDSGGAWLNTGNEIVAVHNGSDIAGGATDYTYGINLFSVKDFILTSINGWHYPTVASASGAKTITVQSLHVGDVANSAYTDGNVTLTGGTCYGTISEFEKCTYIIEATGEGKLWLTSNEYIHVNKPTASGDSGSGGSSGGSLSILSILSMIGFGFYRARKRK